MAIIDQLLIATGNQHKIDEIAAIFAQCGLEGLELLSLDILPGYEPPEENGASFSVNALIKARAAYIASRLPTLADDSGLNVRALDGAPGVMSARYAGEHGDDQANRAKLLADMADIPEDERFGEFFCSAVLLLPTADHQVRVIRRRGRCPGFITWEERGQGGFGYDSIFLPRGLEQTMAELPPEEKNSLSHRGEAMRGIAEFLKKLEG